MSLDLDRIKATLAKYKNLWMDDANALVAEVERLTLELATAKAVGAAKGEKEFAHWWLTRAERLSRLENSFQAKNIAICLASAYRQGKQSIAAELRKGIK